VKMKVQGVFFFSCLVCLAVLSACSTPKAPTPLPQDQITPDPLTAPIPAPTDSNPPTPFTPYPVELPATEQPFPSEFQAPTEQATPSQGTEFIGIAIPITDAPTESFFPNAATMEMVNACSFIKPFEVKSIMSSQPSPTLEPYADEKSYGSYCRYLDDDGGMAVIIGKGNEPTYRFDPEMESIKSNPLFGHFTAEEASFYVAGGRLSDSTSQEYFIGVIIKNDTAAEIYIDEISYIYDPKRETAILLRIANSLPSETKTPVSTPLTPNNEFLEDACQLIDPNEIMIYLPVPPAPIIETINSETEMGSICTYTSGEMELRFGYSYAPTLVNQLRSDLQSEISQNPSIRTFTWLNSEFYLAGGKNERSGIGDAFESVIIKGDFVVTFNGKGDAFKYDFDRESELLKNIAARLP
jgi:hypothetical protein